MQRPSHFIIFFITVIKCALADVGDDWATARGDETTGDRYALATVTSSGRILGMTWGGNLMFSDDGGNTWKFDRIEVNGVPVRGTFSELYQVPGAELIAVMRTLEESSVGYFNNYIRTYLLTSTDNGNTWTQQAFPKTFATLQGTTRRYHGVDILGLHMGPGGQLIAYGTTSGTNHPGFILWSIGGAIFRRTGSDWVQAHFGYGPVGKVADAGGRAVAASYNAILDSTDGAGWNGYTIKSAQINLNGGNQMDPVTQLRLRLLDVEVLGGTYVAQGATFVPYGDSGFIDTSIFQETFKMSSPTPFSGARNWNAYSEPYRGNFTKVGGKIVTSGTGGTYTTSGGGPGFTLANSEMNLRFKAIAAANSSTVYGLESSERVWKSTDGGTSWTKIRDIEIRPDLQFLGAVDGILYALGFRNLWASFDSGATWQERSTEFDGRDSLIDGGDGRLFATAGSDRIQFSEDRGLTWSTFSIPSAGPISVGATTILRSKTGRLIVPAIGKDIDNEGLFYVSDDNGATWSPKVAGLGWNEFPRAIVQTDTGRLIVGTNSFTRLFISDDDGETWSVNKSIQRLDRLNRVHNEPSRRIFELKKFLRSTSGRLLALGDDEIITSDDNGDTWNVRVNMDYNQQGPNLHWEIQDLVQVGNRWIAIGNYRTPYPQSRTRNILLISDDDGATWGQRPFEASQDNTVIFDIIAEPESRNVVISATNGTIFLSESDSLAPPPASDDARERQFVREGSAGTVAVERPDADGAVEASYVLQQRTALAGTDYEPDGGLLTWEADDVSSKLIPIETIDNTTIESSKRELSVQIVFTTSDDFVGTMEIPVAIEDNDAVGPAGLVFNNVGDLYTSEAGDSVEIGFFLESKPSANVSIQVNDLDGTEGTLSETAFTFTPETWNQLQTLTVTGRDDNFPDGDSTYELEFVIITTDTQYASLPESLLAITNRGDEAYVVGGEQFDHLLKGVPIKSSIQDGQFAFSFKIPSSGYSYAFESEVSSDFINWSPGPSPVEGPTENGLTTYTLLLPQGEAPQFARFDWDIIP